MSEMLPDLAPDVRQLAQLALHALSGRSTASLAITGEMVDFAIHRHRCGPLLYRAAQLGAQADDAAKAVLAEHWGDNKRQHLSNRLSTERAAGALAGAKIPALIFKGAPLAQALYPNPLWRHCGDVDILVPRRRMVEAMKVLTESGFHGGDRLHLLPPAIQWLVFAILRDVAIDDSWTETHVEVHSRFLFSRRLSRFHTGLDDTMRPHPIMSDGSLAAPALDVNLALYLIFHGCMSGWCRLKWLVDLAPMLEKLGADGRQALARDAERSGTAAAVKASILLLVAAFGDLDIAPLDSWVAETSDRTAISSRAQRYADWLGGDGSRVPIHTRTEIFKSNILLNDRLADQITTVLASGVSSGVRQIATAAARAIS